MTLREKKETPTLRSLNNLLKSEGLINKEATRFRGEYYLLHILRNGVTVPLFHSKETQEVADYIRMIGNDEHEEVARS